MHLRSSRVLIIGFVLLFLWLTGLFKDAVGLGLGGSLDAFWVFRLCIFVGTGGLSDTQELDLLLLVDEVEDGLEELIIHEVRDVLEDVGNVFV